MFWERGIFVLSIAIDATAACTPKPTGIGRYTEGLTAALSQRAIRLKIGTRYSHFHHRNHRLQISDSKRFWIQEPIWPLVQGVDVLHVTDARVPRWPLLKKGTPRVATLHDVFHILPEFQNGGKYATEEFTRKKIDRYRQIARECDRIICVSEKTRTDFMNHVDCDPQKVEVVHHGIDSHFLEETRGDDAEILESLGIPQGGVLYVGDVSARKNLKGIVEGYLAADLDQDHPLLLVGESTFGSGELESRIRQAGDRILRIGWQKQEILAAIYRQSRALLFCTHYEGFGLPVLESMACGTPVVISRSGATPEVAGGHGHLCDPADVNSIAAALKSALNSSKEDIRAGRDHARRFTWGHCARETEAVYQRAMEVH